MSGRGTRARGRLAAVALLCAAACGFVAAPARAEVRTGSGTDPSADQATGGRDLVGATLEHDTTAGTLTVKAALREAPSAAANGTLVAYAGTWSGATCQGAVVILARLDPANTEGSAWAIPSGPSGSGTRTIDGTTVTLSATAPGLAGTSYDCAFARTTVTNDVSSHHDVLAPFDVAAVAPPETPAPPPAPAPTPPAPPAPTPPAATPPAQKQASTTPLPPPAGVQLAIEAPQLAPVKRNRWRTAKVRVANTGTRAASDVRLRLTLPRGVGAASRTIRLATIKPGKKRTATVKLRLTRKARALSTIAARVTTTTKGAKTAKADLVLRLFGTKQKKAKPAPGPTVTAPAGIVGLSFTRVEVDVMSSNRWYGYTFLDGTWVHRGIPEGGYPTCTTKTAWAEPDGDPGSGCLPYTYDAKTGAVTIDGQPAGTLDAARTTLTSGEDVYTLTPIPPAGSVWNLALKGVAVSGYWPNQVVSQSWLTMTAAGEFSISRETIGTWGGGAMTPGGGNFASVPPDQKGTYAVLPNGVLELRFADGEVQRRTIAIYRDAKTGDADPARVGLLLDDVLYYVDDED